ncbi:hypothetical protein EJ05DRAFT_540164 [Pseudovirgaria hyperparasitica]|uniref:Uncharacterized protein n=1 Tax=Pseudovirgaria hyperparasitica TaxID=470096 RepID=A0A6A6W0A8_9PEZI|nr:uncharacterized protein EJ05DRAFT_540164 [Pseudovirgaria hyperparasitica]KAF2755424.1 hypothetical protein EJ05DRAFT_540164 [Pseudovirgaria hyperparasitica]
MSAHADNHHHETENSQASDTQQADSNHGSDNDGQQHPPKNPTPNWNFVQRQVQARVAFLEGMIGVPGCEDLLRQGMIRLKNDLGGPCLNEDDLASPAACYAWLSVNENDSDAVIAEAAVNRARETLGDCCQLIQVVKAIANFRQSYDLKTWLSLQLTLFVHQERTKENWHLDQFKEVATELNTVRTNDQVYVPFNLWDPVAREYVQTPWDAVCALFA